MEPEYGGGDDDGLARQERGQGGRDEGAAEAAAGDDGKGRARAGDVQQAIDWLFGSWGRGKPEEEKREVGLTEDERRKLGISPVKHTPSPPRVFMPIVRTEGTSIGTNLCLFDDVAGGKKCRHSHEAKVATKGGIGREGGCEGCEGDDEGGVEEEEEEEGEEEEEDVEEYASWSSSGREDDGMGHAAGFGQAPASSVESHHHHPSSSPEASDSPQAASDHAAAAQSAAGETPLSDGMQQDTDKEAAGGDGEGGGKQQGGWLGMAAGAAAVAVGVAIGGRGLYKTAVMDRGQGDGRGNGPGNGSVEEEEEEESGGRGGEVLEGAAGRRVGEDVPRTKRASTGEWAKILGRGIHSAGAIVLKAVYATYCVRRYSGCRSVHGGAGGGNMAIGGIGRRVGGGRARAALEAGRIFHGEEEADGGGGGVGKDELQVDSLCAGLSSVIYLDAPEREFRSLGFECVKIQPQERGKLHPKWAVLKHTGLGIVVVVFRGTFSYADILVDMRFEPIELPCGIQVNGGMHAAVAICADAVKMALRDALRDGVRYRVLVTGHSYGGACSQLLRVISLSSPSWSNILNRVSRVEVVTFGAPLVFGARQSSSEEAQSGGQGGALLDRVGKDSRHYVHQGDIVPRMLTPHSAELLGKLTEGQSRADVQQMASHIGSYGPVGSFRVIYTEPRRAGRAERHIVRAVQAGADTETLLEPAPVMYLANTIQDHDSGFYRDKLNAVCSLGGGIAR